jgi:hypothetical protein
MSDPRPLPDEDVIVHLQRLEPEQIERAGIAPQQVLRILTLIAEARRLDWALPAAQALAHRIEASRLDRACQIARLLGDMATRPPATSRRARALKCDDAPLSTGL